MRPKKTKRPKAKHKPTKVVRKAVTKVVRKPPKARKPGKKTVRKPTTKKQSTRKSARVALQYRREKGCKEVGNLIGPIELDILDNPQTGARIVLLGDKHVNEKKCPVDSRCGTPIWIYLQNVFKQFRSHDRNDFLDFFLEIDFSEEQRFKSERDPKTMKWAKHALLRSDTAISDFLSSTRIYFINCLQRAKEQCEFHGKQIRFHYSDVRVGVIHKTIDKADEAIVKQLQEIWKIHNEPGKVKQHHVQFMLLLLDKLEARDVNYFFRLTKIDKQLKRISDKNIVRLLYEYMENDIKAFNVSIFQVIGKEILENVKSGKPPIDIIGGAWTFSKFVFSIIARAFSPLFDIYTLARMIRLNMKKVIVYAGAAHTRNIKRFLIEHMGFGIAVSRKSESEDTFQCISLKGTPQPWFPS